MMKRDTFAAIVIGAALISTPASNGQAPTDASAALPELPSLPASPGDNSADTTAPAGATPDSSALPALPAAPAVPGTAPGSALPELPGVPSYGGVAAPAAPEVPSPPPLGGLNAEATESTGDNSSPGSLSAAPSQLYSFLFIDDPDNGIVRQKFLADTADVLKETEIQRLMTNRQQATDQGPGIAGIAGAYGGNAFDMATNDPAAFAGDTSLEGFDVAGYASGAGGLDTSNLDAVRAAAEWDFYYNQLEMYDHYVREKLIPDTEGLPTLAYDASNALQERQDLFESFQEGAIQRGNEDFNDNIAFYERIQQREDRRIAYRQWVMHKQNEISEWSDVWARQIYGSRWADGEEVRVDDWYYGTDFNTAKPVLVTMDDREYIVSKEPVQRLQEGQLNVISSNLTPYDIIDGNGYLKNPALETLRGTLVIPPVGPAYATGERTGTIEIVPGSPSE